eukprot:TRINITY_DN801_c0_g1_i1.p1 TRINITY_DN801_c0_g1~~TRINITY_DN801_c0_g1_i1.p1  ORF type:complete len:156 (-),score=3.55 TRINITY_DN801_c0_g1_i1:94-561(-)
MGRTSLNDVGSIIAGCVFSVGWWIWIDGHVWSDHMRKEDPHHPPPVIFFYYYIPAIVGTLALFMTNIAKLDSLSGNYFGWDGDGEATKLRLWLLLSFLLSFGSISASIWMMVAKFLNATGGQYPGVALAVSNVLIFFSSLLLFWCRSSRTDYNEM